MTLPVESTGIGGFSFGPVGNIWRSALGHVFKFFPPHIQDVIALVETRVRLSLTMEECQRYLHITSCPVSQ